MSALLFQRAAQSLAQRVDLQMARRLSLSPLHQLFELGLCCVPNVLPVEQVHETFNAIVHTFNAIVRSIRVRGLEGAMKERGTPSIPALTGSHAESLPGCAHRLTGVVWMCCVLVMSGFQEFKMRGELRFDMAIKPGELAYLHGAERAWLPVVEAALGPGYRLIHMVRSPDAQPMAWQLLEHCRPAVPFHVDI